MEKKNGYIGIEEYAELSGISLVEAFSEVIRGDLTGLYKEVDRRTFVSVKALERHGKTLEEPKEESNKTSPLQCDEIKKLLNELDIANRTISEQQEKITNLSLELAEMAKKCQEITDKALTTVNQQQILTAMVTKKEPWYKRLLSAGKQKEL